MGSRFALHLSLYSTLALAAVCLASSEMFFLPWMPIFLAGILLTGWMAWKHEGRWQLSESGANTIGLAIALGMFGWILFKIPRSEEEMLAAGVPWPAGLLPHLGPLLMVLTAVKLFRPKKVSDFWVLQVLGVMMMTLASVLAGDLDHGVWVFGYVVCLIWCLYRFHLDVRVGPGRSGERRDDLPLFPVEATTPPGASVRGQGFGRAVGWATAAGVSGIAIFAAAPRHTGIQWLPHKLTVGAINRFSAGFDYGMDLNRTGKVELSDEVAFEVQAQDHTGRSVVVSTDLYWQSEALDYYQNGRWYPGGQTSDMWAEPVGASEEGPRPGGNRPVIGPRSRFTNTPLRILSVPSPTMVRQPDERPEGLSEAFTYLTIRTQPAMGDSLVVAEPVDVDAGIGLHPFLGDRPSRAGLFGHLVVCDSIVPLLQTRRSTYSYGQAIDLKADPKQRPASRMHPKYIDIMLRQPPPSAFLPLAKTLLHRVGGLSEAERTLDDSDTVAPQHRAAVAKAFTRHFANSGEYLYSLSINRVDASIDPNLDFLLNVKHGHCERYASGLTLLLRAVGIPARVIHGFYGGELTDDNRFIVRFNHAHSWVQALVPSPTVNSESEANPDDPGVWLLLEPTPSLEAPIDRWTAFCDWANFAIRQVRAGFRNSVLDYGADSPTWTLRSWVERALGLGDDGFADPLVLIAPALLLVLGLTIGRRTLSQAVRRWLAPHSSRPAWLEEALAIVQSHFGRSLAPTQTLVEFADSLPPPASDFRKLAIMANALAFGHRSLDSDDHATITGALASLRSSTPSS